MNNRYEKEFDKVNDVFELQVGYLLFNGFVYRHLQIQLGYNDDVTGSIDTC